MNFSIQTTNERIDEQNKLAFQRSFFETIKILNEVPQAAGVCSLLTNTALGIEPHVRFEGSQIALVNVPYIGSALLMILQKAVPWMLSGGVPVRMKLMTTNGIPIDYAKVWEQYSTTFVYYMRLARAVHHNGDLAYMRDVIDVSREINHLQRASMRVEHGQLLPTSDEMHALEDAIARAGREGAVTTAMSEGELAVMRLLMHGNIIENNARSPFSDPPMQKVPRLSADPLDVELAQVTADFLIIVPEMPAIGEGRPVVTVDGGQLVRDRDGKVHVDWEVPNKRGSEDHVFVQVNVLGTLPSIDHPLPSVRSLIREVQREDITTQINLVAGAESAFARATVETVDLDVGTKRGTKLQDLDMATPAYNNEGGMPTDSAVRDGALLEIHHRNILERNSAATREKTKTTLFGSWDPVLQRGIDIKGPGSDNLRKHYGSVGQRFSQVHAAKPMDPYHGVTGAISQMLNVLQAIVDGGKTTYGSRVGAADEVVIDEMITNYHIRRDQMRRAIEMLFHTLTTSMARAFSILVAEIERKVTTAQRNAAMGAIRRDLYERDSQYCDVLTSTTFAGNMRILRGMPEDERTEELDQILSGMERLRWGPAVGTTMMAIYQLELSPPMYKRARESEETSDIATGNEEKRERRSDE